MIRFLNDNEKRRSKELYQHSFPEDSERFLEYYFGVKTVNNRIMVDEVDGEIVSMANLNPYTVVFYNQRRELDYIIAVATHEKYRRQGRMRGLLKEIFDVLYEERKPFTYLKPANKDYYLPFGFAYISEVWETVAKEELKEIHLDAKPCDEEMIREYSDVLGEDYFSEQGISLSLMDEGRKLLGFGSGLFDEWILEFQNAWLHANADVYCYRSKEYLSDLYQRLGTDLGKITLYFTQDNVLAGVKVYWDLEQKEILEFLGDLQYFDMVSTKQPDKMARIIHLEEFVQVLRLKPDSPKHIETVKFRIKDDMIAENNGTYLWHLNREFSYTEKLEHEDKVGLFEVGIDDFVAWAFGQKELNDGYLFENIERLHTAMINEEV